MEFFFRPLKIYYASQNKFKKSEKIQVCLLTDVEKCWIILDLFSLNRTRAARNEINLLIVLSLREFFVRNLWIYFVDQTEWKNV